MKVWFWKSFFFSSVLFSQIFLNNLQSNQWITKFTDPFYLIRYQSQQLSEHLNILLGCYVIQTNTLLFWRKKQEFHISVYFQKCVLNLERNITFNFYFNIFRNNANLWLQSTVSRFHTKGWSKIFFRDFWHFLVRIGFLKVQKASTPKNSIKFR